MARMRRPGATPAPRCTNSLRCRNRIGTTCETLVVVNPNNPDGRIIARADLAAFALAWTAGGRRLIVDEAFADVRPELSMLALPELPVGTIVLRSLGKFFGLAGLRVGFVVATEPDATAWRQLLGDWPVSGPACEIATSALRDTNWIAATRTRLAADRKRLDGVLGNAGLKMLGGTDLFGCSKRQMKRTCSTILPAPEFWCAALPMRRGVTGSGFPADEAAWRRLEAACAKLV